MKSKLEQLAEGLLKYPNARQREQPSGGLTGGSPSPVGVPFTGRVNYKFDPSLLLTATRRDATRVAFSSKRSVRHGPPAGPRRKISDSRGIRRSNIHS